MNNEEKSYAEQIAIKDRRKKIIISSISLGLVLMIAITIICLATIKVSLKPDIIDDPYYFYFNAETDVRYGENYNVTEKTYKEMMGEFENCFQVSYLTGIFSNSISDYEIVEDKITELPSSVTDNAYITFVYNEAKTLTEKNGKTYYSIYNTSNSIDFTEVTFVLSDSNKISDMSMYLKYTSGKKDYYAEIKLKGNTNSMYEIYKAL